MITDNETNFVFFSSVLAKETKYKKFLKELISILKQNDVNFGLLENTKDIWCRDFMPIQISEDEFVEYKYDPDYLQTTPNRKYKTYPDFVCNNMYLKTTKSDLILDGGNVIKSENSVILTDKIVEENKDFYNRDQIIKILKLLFNVENVLLIPWDKKEKFGHADGMVRFLDEKTVLLNGYFEKYSDDFKNKLFGELKRNGIEWTFLKYNVKNEREKLNWAYINFLQTNNLLLIPKFGIDEDNQAFEQIKNYFPEYAKNDSIKQIDCSVIVKEGGALNCISWNVQKPTEIPNPTTLYFIQDVINKLNKRDWQQLFDLIPEFSKNNFDYIENKFFEIVNKLNLVINFDWKNWNKGNELIESRDFNLNNFDLVELCKYITVFVRHEKFCNGFLSSEIRSGKILKVINRMNEIINK